MGAGIDPNQAVLRYKDLVGRVGGSANATQPPVAETPPAPPVSPSSGSLPAPEAVSPGKLKKSELEDLVNQMLEASKTT